MLFSCGPRAEGPNGDCDGKCDGNLASRFVDLFSDPSTFEPGDLSKWSADFVTGKINDLIQVPTVGGVSVFRPRLAKTDVYALEQRAGNSFTIKSLPTLTAGLTQAYGEQDYFTRINALRRRHLERHRSQVWTEARFELPANPQLGFSVNDIGLSFGFTALDRGVSATVIAPHEAAQATDLARALVQAPSEAARIALGESALGSLTGHRGLPDSLSDFRAMSPGAMIALHTDRGVSGFTFNAATPVYVASISEATLYARISAAAHVIATGALDVQLVRDEGDQLVVDVGITQQGSADAPNMHFRLAVDGYWGLQAFTGGAIDIGPLTLDVADLANKEVQRQLNKHFQPLKAAIEWNPAAKTRHTITRLAFDLSAQGVKRANVERALKLATNGVLWYAQLLAARPDSGVTTLLDVDRLARRPSFYVGLQLPVLGMSFHYERRKNIGNATITADGMTQQLFWNELQKNTGWFWTDKDYKVAGIASVRTEAGTGKPIDADYNMRLILVEKQGRVARDEIVDQVDPLLALFIGTAGLDKISPHTDALERYIDGCGAHVGTATNNDDWEDCALPRPSTGTAALHGFDARRALDAHISQGGLRGQLDMRHTSAASFARQLLALKIAAQSLPEDNSISPPESEIKVQARLSKSAIERILGAPEAKTLFENELTEVVKMVNVWRKAPRGHQCTTWDEEIGEGGRTVERTYCSDNPKSYAKEIAEVGAAFERQVEKFNRLSSLSSLQFRARDGQMAQMGDHGVVVEIDERGRLVEPTSEQDKAVVAIAERKAEALRRFFDKMVGAAEPGLPLPLIGRLFGGLGHTEHQLIAYTLMHLAGPDQLELLVQADFDDEPKYNGRKVVDLPELRLYGRGADAKLIDAGRFGLEALIGN